MFAVASNYFVSDDEFPGISRRNVAINFRILLSKNT
jgi:hypothetical protein